MPQRLFEDDVYFKTTFFKSFTTITVVLFKNIRENSNIFKVPEEGRLRYTGKILGLNNATAHWENSEERASKYGHFELKKQLHTIKYISKNSLDYRVVMCIFLIGCGVYLKAAFIGTFPSICG